MASSNSSPDRRRVRPITWAILAWMLIMVAAILGAWQGTESKYGAEPTLHASTTGHSTAVPPFLASDLDGNTYENPITEIPLEADGFLSVRMPSEVYRGPHWVFEIRDGEQLERFVAPGEGQSTILVDATTEAGRLEAVSVRAQAVGYTADGEDTVYDGEWTIDILQLGEDVSADAVADLPMHGEPALPAVEVDDATGEIPDDDIHSGFTNGS